MSAPRPVILVALITSICLMGDAALYVLLPSRLEVFAVTPTGAGLILGVNRFIRILSNGWASTAYERFGFFRPFAFSIGLAAITTLSYGLTKGFWALFIAHGVWGIAWSLIRMGGYLAVIENSKSGNTGQLMGFLQSFSRGGSLIAVIGGGFIADYSGAGNAFLVLGIITIFAFGLLPFVSFSGKLGAGSSVQANLETTNVIISRMWFIRNLYFVAFVAWMIVAGLVVSTAGYLVRVIVGEEAVILGFVVGVGTLSGLLVSIRWFGDLTLGPISGYISDRIGRHVVIIGSLSIIGIALTTVAILPIVWVVIPSFTLIFFSSTALLVSLNASIAVVAPPKHRMKILGRYATFSDAGSGIGPIFALPMVANLGFSWSYGLGAAVILVALTIFALAFRAYSVNDALDSKE